MLTIAIKLDPARMGNPDLEVRYEIPDRITLQTNGAVTDGGYDYVEDDSLVIYLKTSGEDHVMQVLSILQNEGFCGNKILDCAIVGIDSGEGFRTVYPSEFRDDVFYGTSGS